VAAAARFVPFDRQLDPLQAIVVGSGGDSGERGPREVRRGKRGRRGSSEEGITVGRGKRLEELHPIGKLLDGEALIPTRDEQPTVADEEPRRHRDDDGEDPEGDEELEEGDPATLLVHATGAACGAIRGHQASPRIMSKSGSITPMARMKTTIPIAITNTGRIKSENSHIRSRIRSR
jgi:hypothetical protein